MRFWLVTVGEPLPTDEGSPRLLRAGLLFQALLDRGHRVRWWTSAWDHHRKTLRAPGTSELEVHPRGAIALLPSLPYHRNVGVRRLISQAQVARRFRKVAAGAEPPDLILASYPTIELAAEAVDFGRGRGLPVLLDIRDLWPDQIWDSLLPTLRVPRALALWPMRRQARRAIRGATAITGVTDEFVTWALKLARRDRGPLDRPFPMGYPAPDEEEVPPAAFTFWRDRGLRDDDWIACFFGTLGRQFRMEPVFEAAEELGRRLPEVRFVICGAGDSLGRYRRRAAGLPNVMLPGWVDAPRIRALMAMSRAGLAPYPSTPNYTANLPNKPVEYLAGGLPVLYSMEGVLDRICRRESCGLRYDPSPGAEDRLAAVIQRLHGAEAERRAMSERARALFQREYRADRVYGRMAAFLEDVARGAGAVGGGGPGA